MLKLRAVTALAAAAVVAVGVSACGSSQAGLVGTVSGNEVTISQADSLLTGDGLSDAAKAQSGDLAPIFIAADWLIETQVYREALAANGGIPTQGQLDAVHDKAAAEVLQATDTGNAIEKKMIPAYAEYGLNEKAVNTRIHLIELQYTLEHRVNATTFAELLAAVNRAHPVVTVNPRFGSWDGAKLQMQPPTGAIPGLMSGSPTASAAA